MTESNGHTDPRRSHAAMDREVRVLKARKIEALLDSRVSLDGAHIIDVGTGAGVIAEHFARRVGSRGRVCSVDVRDQRSVTEGFEFSVLEDSCLPFVNGSFDGAISNHVIEHVGSRSQQLRYLQEINRVIKRSGWLYLATPNRWSLMEPHYRLPLLSWLPNHLQSLYVRATGNGKFYDCRLLDRSDTRSLLSAAGWQECEITTQALKLTAQIEKRSRIVQGLTSIPTDVLDVLLMLIPTLVYFAHKSDAA